jgi:hypothetical protein
VLTSRKGNTLGPHRLGRGRAEIETNLQKEWGVSGLSDEQIDKCRYLEKKTDLKDGFMPGKIIDRVR